MTTEPGPPLLTDDEAEPTAPAHRRFDWDWWGGQATVLGLTLLVTYLVLVLLPPFGRMAAHPVVAPGKHFTFVARPDVQYFLFIAKTFDGDEFRCEIRGDGSASEGIGWVDELFRQPPGTVDHQGTEYWFWHVEVSGKSATKTVSCEQPALVQAGVPISYPRVWIAAGMIGVPLAGCVIATMRHRRDRRDREERSRGEFARCVSRSYFRRRDARSM